MKFFWRKNPLENPKENIETKLKEFMMDKSNLKISTDVEGSSNISNINTPQEEEKVTEPEGTVLNEKIEQKDDVEAKKIINEYRETIKEINLLNTELNTEKEKLSKKTLKPETEIEIEIEIEESIVKDDTDAEILKHLHRVVKDKTIEKNLKNKWKVESIDKKEEKIKAKIKELAKIFSTGEKLKDPSLEEAELLKENIKEIQREMESIKKVGETKVIEEIKDQDFFKKWENARLEYVENTEEKKPVNWFARLKNKIFKPKNREIEEKTKNKEDLEKVKIIITEEIELNEQKIENLPKKEKGSIRKAIDWYRRQSKGSKLLIIGTLLVGINEIYPFKKMEKNLTNLFKGDVKKEKKDTLKIEHKNTETLDSLKMKKEEIDLNKKDKKINYEIIEKKPIENNSTYTIPEEELIIVQPEEKKTKQENNNYIIGEEELPEIKNTNLKTEKQKPAIIEQPKQKVNPDTIKTLNTKEPEKEKAINKKEESKLSPKIQKIYDSNNTFLFPNNENTHAWDNIKGSTGLSAEHMMNMKEGSTNSVYNPYISYIHKLHYYTNLKPQPGETNEQYVKRALQKLSKMEKLDKIKLD